MNLSSLLPFLLHSFKSENDLVQAIQELSLKFTKDRKNISDYLNDERLVSAYSAFYLTTNLPKFEAILPWLPEEFCHDIKSCDFIDLGAGPGTMSLGWMNWLGKSEGEVYQVETSELMKKQAKKIWQGLYPEKNLHQSSAWNEKNERPKVVVFGHSANEMGSELSLRYLEKINPDHIIFIEPGTPEFFQEMLIIRESLLKDKFDVVYPCPSALACPMANTSDWCHQFIQVRHDPEVERLSQILKKDRKLLPLTVHVYSKKKYEKSSERLVRVMPETKFSFEWEVCHNNKLEHYQLMRRGLEKKKTKILEAMLSGAGLETEIEKELENAKRVKLIRIK